MSSLLLDTNIYSAFVRGKFPELSPVFGKAERINISTIVLGELFFGFKHGNQRRKNYEILNRFLFKPNVLIHHVSEITADHYSDISLHLRKIGAPIPTNDIWIAAQAMETNSTLISLDRHFEQIKGLKLFNPATSKNST